MLTTASHSSSPPVARTAILLFAAGLPGVLSLLLVLPAIEGVPRAVLLVNPLLLLAGMSFAGAWASPRCGFVLAGRNPGGSMVAMGAIGVAAGALLALLDQLTHPSWSAGTMLPSMTGAWSAAALLSGMLYGGVTEEIMMRWGLMALITVGVRRVVRPSSERAMTGTVLAGALVSSLLFAAGHLPALALQGDLVIAAVIRTLGLNLLAGLLFAAVFARHGLLVAMACHAGFHVGVALAAGASLLAS